MFDKNADATIIKALEHCSQNYDCVGCILTDECNKSAESMMSLAVAVIKRKDDEIKMLKNKIVMYEMAGDIK
jgi:hypothetical protein